MVRTMSLNDRLNNLKLRLNRAEANNDKDLIK